MPALHVVVPACNPGEIVIGVIERARVHADAIVIVDDGCDAENRARLERCARHPGVTLLAHEGNRGKDVALLTPVGLAVAILLLFGLGIAGTLTGPGILAGAGVALALACWRLRDRIAPGVSGTARAIACTATPARLVMIAIAATVLVPIALNGLTPPIHSDEVRYHLPYALYFVEQGRIVPDLYLRFPFFTLNVNLLYAAAIVFGDDVTPHYVHLLLGTLAGLALYALAAPRFGRITASCAVLLFFATPNFTRFAATAYIDLGLAAFVTAAIACLDRARGRPALVVCAGLAFGAALGTKYLALTLLPLLVGWAAYRTRAGRQVARFAAVAVLAGAPWYVYNLVWTGNPVSPFAADWFGTWPWTAEDLTGQTRQLDSNSVVGCDLAVGAAGGPGEGVSGRDGESGGSRSPPPAATSR